MSLKIITSIVRIDKVKEAHEVQVKSMYSLGGPALEAFGLQKKEKPEHVLMAHCVSTAHTLIAPASLSSLGSCI
jgi:hypothetical protein